MALMDHYKAPLKNWNFVKSQIFPILNLSVTKCF